MTPTTYLALQQRDLLNQDKLDRLRNDSVWFESVQWLKKLGPNIPIPIGGVMVPFGISSYGDWWCWQVEGDDPDKFPVLICPPDTGDCTFFSSNFDSMLFRQILDFASNDVFRSEGNFDDDTRFTVGEMHAQIQIWMQQFKEFFPSLWVDVLNELTTTVELKEYAEPPHFSYSCLLSHSDLLSLESSLLQFDRLDEEFEFDRLAVDWYGE